MVLLKNRRAWLKWAKAEGLESQESRPLEPAEYPCYAYTILHSFGYEELAEKYLYRKDLKDMKDRIDSVRRANRVHCKLCNKRQPRLSETDVCDEAARAVQYSRAGE